MTTKAGGCAVAGCIALAAKDSIYCAVHRWRDETDRLLKGTPEQPKQAHS